MDEAVGLKIAEAINKEFGPPFLKENFVQATYRGYGILGDSVELDTQAGVGSNSPNGGAR